jgi:hypothetical protein
LRKISNGDADSDRGPPFEQHVDGGDGEFGQPNGRHEAFHGSLLREEDEDLLEV